MTTVYGMKSSGNCYKVQLLLEQLGAPYRWIDVDSANGQTRTPQFLVKNTNGRVPLLELDDGRRLAESNAILHYLADGTPLLPSDRWLRAQTLQWLFFEQYSHDPTSPSRASSACGCRKITRAAPNCRACSIVAGRPWT